MRKFFLSALLASCLAAQVASAQSSPAAPTSQPAAAPGPTPAPTPTAPRVVASAPAPAPRVIEPAAPAAAPVAPVELQPGPATSPQGVPVNAPSTLPPPPPGYVYAPAVGAPAVRFDPQRRQEIYGELERVDDRLKVLGAERHKVSIAGPIVLMATGYGVALISSFVALASWATAESIEHDDYWDYDDADFNNDGRINHHDEHAARNTARVFTGLAAVGLGMGIGGTMWFGKRMSERRLHAPEIHELKERRHDLRRELQYGAMLAPDRAQLTLRTQF